MQKPGIFYETRQFTIIDERELTRLSQFSANYECTINPTLNRTLKDVYEIIYKKLKIPAVERDMININFLLNNEFVCIASTNELLAYDSIIAVVSDKDISNVLNDSLETDKKFNNNNEDKFHGEKINQVPSFAVHQSQNVNNNVQVYFITFDSNTLGWRRERVGR